MELAKLLPSVVAPFLANLRHKKPLLTNETTMTEKDIQKLKDALATKEDVAEIKTDLASLETKLEEVADAVNAHSVKLDNLATKHDLELMLEKSESLGVLKAEFELMKKYMREKLHVEI
jgi:hypothetical protein